MLYLFIHVLIIQLFTFYTILTNVTFCFLHLFFSYTFYIAEHIVNANVSLFVKRKLKKKIK